MHFPLKNEELLRNKGGGGSYGTSVVIDLQDKNDTVSNDPTNRDFDRFQNKGV